MRIRPENKRDEAALRTLLSQQQMRLLLKKERARSDRTGDVFTIITFAAREPGEATSLFAELARILKARLRLTDEVGWFDQERVAAILPCTPPAGAWKVADDVLLTWDTAREPPLITVYAYPDLPDHDDDSSHGARSLGELEPKPVQAMDRLLSQPLPIWKRMLDIVGAVIGLVACAPLLALVALAVKLSSRGPVFFKQMRSGLGGRRFWIYKFRTMEVGAEARRAALAKLSEQDGPAFKMRRDPRVTRLGRLLRATSIDELPQLWNVLLGDMSLVGPRPLPVSEQDASLRWQRRRLDVTPGLTCIWQVHGRSRVSFNDWMRMDLRYLGGRSLAGDLRLLLQTVPALIFRRGM